MTTKKHITVCICTYKRPERLNNLLTKLERQQTEYLFDCSIVIVDNDKYESAQQTVSDYSVQSQVSINYYVAPEQNIALARNKAIENATGDLIAFIDDDEFPDDDWLLNLYKAINKYDSDGVLGPVLPYFETEPPHWVLKGHFFDRVTHQTGHILTWTNTRTGNVLLKKDLLKKGHMWFNPIFGSGGEDRDFFRRMIEEGAVFVWSNEAPVYEIIPPHRWEIKVLRKRAFLRGKMALKSSKSKLLSVLYSSLAILIYTCCLPLFFIFGRHIFIKYLIKLSDHLGKVAAFLGFNLVTEKYVGV